MNISPRLVFAFLAFVALLRPSLTDAQAIEIQQHWVVGKSYEFSARMEQASSFAIGPQKMDQKAVTTMTMSLAVRPHEDGQSKRLTLKYERMAMDMEMNDQKMSFDSDKPGEGTDPLNLGKTLGAVVGKEVKMIANAQDQITEIENFDEFIRQFPAVPGMDPAKMFGKEQLQQMMKQGALQALPGHPVSAGDSWPFSHEMTLPQLGKLSVKGTYTYQGMEDHEGVSCARIQNDATMDMDISVSGSEGSPQKALGMKITDGSLKGTIWFDLALGTARDAALVQEMKMSMKDPTDPSKTVEIPMKQTITTTLTKVEDVK